MDRARRCRAGSLVVAGPTVLEHLVCRALPALADAFGPLRALNATARESETAHIAYARLEPTDFSRDVLERCPERLAVLPVTGTA